METAEKGARELLMEVRALLKDGIVPEGVPLDPDTILDMTHWSQHKPGCGTAYCIGGLMCMLADGKIPDYRGQTGLRAIRLLGKPGWLFFVDEWPVDLQRAYCSMEGPDQERRLAIEAIDRYIEERWNG
jgi:hypothetical protein